MTKNKNIKSSSTEEMPSSDPTILSSEERSFVQQEETQDPAKFVPPLGPIPGPISGPIFGPIQWPPNWYQWGSGPGQTWAQYP